MVYTPGANAQTVADLTLGLFFRYPGQYLRGGIVDEKALYRALKEGVIAGAALDVFEPEPPGKTPRVELDNFIGCPHIGGITVEAIGRIGMTVARDIVAVWKGQSPKFLANKEWLVPNR